MPSPYQLRQAAKRQSDLEARAHHMRHHQTPSEERLWAELRGGRLGVTFRRQVVIGRYIVDFASREASLIVEVDGGIHRARAHLDLLRDAHLARAGYRVVRIAAELVIQNPVAAAALVARGLAL
jgi:very-short-patch-repair endonuclease